MPPKLIAKSPFMTWKSRAIGLVAILPTTVNVRLELRAGEPLSVTATVMVLVELFGPGMIQRKKPVFGSITAPAGALAPRANVRAFAGISASVAVAVKLTVVPR